MKEQYVIDYKDPGKFDNNSTYTGTNRITSTPMPTIDTTPAKNTGDINVEIKYFDGRVQNFIFRVTYEERDSHHLFSGNGDDPNSCNTTGKPEIMVAGVSWDTGIKPVIEDKPYKYNNIYDCIAVQDIDNTLYKREEYWVPQD